MSAQKNKYTFESLCQMNRGKLEELLLQGVAPQLDEVLGYEFRGFNIQRATRFLGNRKFKKGFFGRSGAEYAWGYNVRVYQNDFDGPWVARPSDEFPDRLYFYKVYPAPASASAMARYPNTLVVDYRAWGEYCPLNPVGYTMDYLAFPDPENRDLIIGNSYLETPLGTTYLGHFILERHNESNYGRETHFLTDREKRTVRAFAEVFIEGGERVVSPEEITENVDRYLERVESKRKRSLKLLLFIIEYVLPRRRYWPFRVPFSRMKPAARRRLIEDRLQSPRNRGPLRDLAKIKTLFLAGYYGDERVYQSIGFVPVSRREKYQPDRLVTLGIPRPSLTEPAEDEVACQVCVIGSGAGGAVVAYHAAAAGKDVILLEEGRYVAPESVVQSETEMVPRLYKEGGLQSTVDMDMSILQGKTLGGTTTINNLICLRLDDAGLTPGASPDVLAAWAELGAHIDREALGEAYDRVEAMIGAAPLLETQEEGIGPIDGGNARVFLDGWAALVQEAPELERYRHGLFHKNARRCLGCGYCNFGCAFERKMSMVETYIPGAIEHGARVMAGCHAVGIERSGRRATAVRCRLRNGRPLLVRAESVVVACGAIGSSVLLMKSGVRRNVGQRFSFNAGTPVYARFPFEVTGYDGVQMAAYIDGGDYLLETLFNPPLAFATALPGWFGDHFGRMLAYNHFASAGVLIGTEANGRVKRRSFTRNLFGPVAYEMKDGDLDKLKAGIARLSELYFAGGAEVVYPATFADSPLERERYASKPEEIRRFLDERIRKPEDLTLNSSHPQGGNPMSDRESIGVVDSRFRVHGFENLFVCDASVFPTTVRINPQLTIMAMADYFAHLDVL
jgi:choline dehydrogenase-like flavoprotein